MANVADLNLIQINNFPEVESPEDWIVVSDASGKGYKISKENFKAFLGTVQVLAPKAIAPTDPAPTLDGVYKPTIDGTYANAGGIVVNRSEGGADYGKSVEFIKNGSNWVKVTEVLPGVTVVNDLTTGGTSKVLSAEQGKILKNLTDKKIDKSSIIVTNGGYQLFNKYLYNENTTLSGTGELIPSAGSKVTTLIKIKEGQSRISISGLLSNGGSQIAFYREDGSLLSLYGIYSDTHIAVIPALATSFRVKFHSGSNIDPDVDNRIMINFGAGVMPLEPYTERVISIDGKYIKGNDDDHIAQKWTEKPYNPGELVFHDNKWWEAIANASPADIPGEAMTGLRATVWKSTKDEAARRYITGRLINQAYGSSGVTVALEGVITVERFPISPDDIIVWKITGASMYSMKFFVGGVEQVGFSGYRVTEGQIQPGLTGDATMTISGLQADIEVYVKKVSAPSSYLNPVDEKESVNGKAISEFISGKAIEFDLIGKLVNPSGGYVDDELFKSTYPTRVIPESKLEIVIPSGSVGIRQFTNNMTAVKYDLIRESADLAIDPLTTIIIAHTQAGSSNILKVKGVGGSGGGTNVNNYTYNTVNQNLIDAESRFLGVVDANKLPSDFPGYDSLKANLFKVADPLVGSENWGGFTYTEADLLIYDITLVRSSDGTWAELKKSTVPSPRKHSELLVDIRDFGSNGNDNDDQSAFDNAIAQVVSQGYGVIYLPAGVYNGSFIFPATGVENRANVEIRGEDVGPRFTVGTVPWPEGRNPNLPEIGAMIIKSSDPAKGAVIRAAPGSGYWLDFSTICVKLKNLDIRTNDNPQLDGIDMAHANQLWMENVHVNTGIYNGNSAEPTYGKTGIITPKKDNAAIVNLTNVGATGYGTGIVMTEHFSGHNLYVHGCKTALRINHAGHSSHITKILVQACKRIIEIDDRSLFAIQQLTVEKNSNPVNPWYSPDAFDIYCNHESARGVIECVTVGGSPVVLSKTGSAANIKQRIPGSVAYV